MRKITILALMLFASAAQAQQTGGNLPPIQERPGVTIGTNADSNSTSGALSSTNNAVNVAISSHTPDRQGIDYSGSYNVKTNTMVALAAGVSMSSDYCGGTASGGASAAGVTIGAAKPIIDANCQALRLIEKTGIAAVTSFNLGDKETAHKLKRLMVWQICVSETENGNRNKANQIPSVEQACKDLGLIVERGMDRSTDPRPVTK